MCLELNDLMKFQVCVGNFYFNTDEKMRQLHKNKSFNLMLIEAQSYPSTIKSIPTKC